MSTKMKWEIRLHWYAWAIGFYYHNRKIGLYLGPIEVLRYEKLQFKPPDGGEGRPA